MAAWMKKNLSLDERVTIVNAKLQASLGDRLESVVLYGSALGSHWHPEHSDVNLIIVYKGEDFDILDIAAAVRKELVTHNVNILWFAEGELPRATDVFPIELLDLKLRRRVLFGSDPISDIVIYRPDLRMACERFGREKLLSLRTHYQNSAGEEHALRTVLLRSAPGWSAVFQAILYLYDMPVPEHATERVEAVADKLKFEPAPFQALFEWRMHPKSGNTVFLMQLYRNYLKAVKNYTIAIDQWEENV